MQKVDFDLPLGIQIKALRFDPLNGPGIFEIGPAELIGPDGRRVTTIDTAAYRAHYQLRVLSTGSAALKVAAPPGSLDPIVLITLPYPLVLSATTRDWPAATDWFLIALSIVVVGIVILYKPKANARDKARAENAFATSNRVKWMDRLAQKLTDPRLIIFRSRLDLRPVTFG